ncbi:sensor histidine kinase [Amphibacillus xylanus]|uniref:sensor histidine kinase n=1 Tax=Amphibacillus xylanus TaxID=1449 RepID=UPI00030028DB|nr:histidine kinase [Amphibacillus xylanus]
MKFFQRWNTLRNQILAVYLIVLLIVLATVSYFIFNQVAQMLRENAEAHVQQTAKEAIGRYDSLYEQLNLITKQIATNDQLQSILLNERNGIPATFQERQDLVTLTSRLQANADGIYITEIFDSDYDKLTPLDGPGLVEQIGTEYIKKAEQARGKMIWIGDDRLNPDYFLVVRRISLMSDNFENGGYLLARINKSYFQTHTGVGAEDQLMIVLDHQNQVVSTNYSEFAKFEGLIDDNQMLKINEDNYIRNSETSRETGWTVIMLTPISRLTEGLPVLRTIIAIAGLIGFIIFLIFSLFLSTYITKPINRLTDTMRQAGKGTLTLSPASIAPNEINELNNTYNQLAEQTNYLIQMVYEKELIKSRTELKALQAQINPHFLFNTLDLLYWSLDEKGEDDLAEMVISMSNLFRYTITPPKEDEWVTLREELEHIKQYMMIMKMRFDERLTYCIKIDPELLDNLLPKLIIQPLIENAVLHGLSDQIKNGLITLSVEATDDNQAMIITVADNGKGMSKEKIERIYQKINRKSGVQISGDGMALANVERRLQLYYNPEQVEGISISSEESKGTLVQFKIPIIK